MIWYVGGGIILGLAAYGIFRSVLRQAVIVSYVAGWNEAMKMRSEWDKNRAVDAISDNMLMKVSRNGKELVN